MSTYSGVNLWLADVTSILGWYIPTLRPYWSCYCKSGWSHIRFCGHYFILTWNAQSRGHCHTACTIRHYIHLDAEKSVVCRLIRSCDFVGYSNKHVITQRDLVSSFHLLRFYKKLPQSGQQDQALGQYSARYLNHYERRIQAQDGCYAVPANPTTASASTQSPTFSHEQRATAPTTAAADTAKTTTKEYFATSTAPEQQNDTPDTTKGHRR